MHAEPDVLALAADFAPPTRAQWRALVAAVLAKSGLPLDTDPEDALSHRSYDGIDIRPLYTADDAPGLDRDGVPGQPPFVRGPTLDGATVGGWQVVCRPPSGEPARVNAVVLTDLERGATSIWLTLVEGGLSPADLPAALDGVLLDLAPIVLDAGADTEAAADALLALASSRGIPAADLAGSLGADPIGTRARTGAPADLDVLVRLEKRRAGAIGLQVANVDASIYHDAGASDAQEIGIATAVGVAYLRALTDAGLPLDEALEAVGFRFAVTADQFASVAKLRAARRVWDRVAQLSGAAADRRGQRQHAVTSAAMFTRRDPWVNMLRATIACFAAAVGGADAITVTPFDAAIGESDEFARRIARNTHAILHDEASLARVLDAAGGSWFVESLTDQLAQAAWEVFTVLERGGGALSALDDGTIEDLLAVTRAARAADIAHRRAPITGVSEFADVAEAPVLRPAPPNGPDGALLPAARWASDFEELRDRADVAAADGSRPLVFLAGLGTAAAHSARVSFAANLFRAGGLDCVTGTGSTEDLVAEFTAADTDVACVCGLDAVYAEQGGSVSAALRAAGASYIWIAGRTDVDGVDGELYAGCDALDALRATFAALGVA